MSKGRCPLCGRPWRSWGISTVGSTAPGEAFAMFGHDDGLVCGYPVDSPASQSAFNEAIAEPVEPRP